MKYYRVKPENDNKTRFILKNDGTLKTDGIFVGGELYTEKEIKKYFGGVLMCDLVNVSSRKTYFFFGARLKMEG